MTKHTPGPWTDRTITTAAAACSPGEEMTEIGQSDDDGGLSVALVWGDADSRLIAAAPELLAALVQVTNEAHLINAKQHAGNPIPDELWSGLYDSTNHARAIIIAATEGTQ